MAAFKSANGSDASFSVNFTRKNKHIQIFEEMWLLVSWFYSAIRKSPMCAYFETQHINIAFLSKLYNETKCFTPTCVQCLPKTNRLKRIWKKWRNTCVDLFQLTCAQIGLDDWEKISFTWTFSSKCWRWKSKLRQPSPSNMCWNAITTKRGAQIDPRFELRFPILTTALDLVC